MTDELRASLARHGKSRARARVKAQQESAAIRGLARLALDAGMSKSEIARIAGVTRPALDTMLRDDD